MKDKKQKGRGKRSFANYDYIPERAKKSNC